MLDYRNVFSSENLEMKADMAAEVEQERQRVR